MKQQLRLAKREVSPLIKAALQKMKIKANCRDVAEIARAVEHAEAEDKVRQMVVIIG